MTSQLTVRDDGEALGRSRATVIMVGIVGVAGATALRWTLLRLRVAPGVDGVLFAMALVGVAVTVRFLDDRSARGPSAITSSPKPRPSLVRSVAVGVLGGAVLIAVPLLARAPGAGALAPAQRADVALPVWISVTLLVVASEELLFRGVLLDVLVAGRSVVGAVALTSLLFGLVHVPFYGWAALPVDVAAAVWLCGLRFASGRLIAPGIAHALADLVTWWL